MKPYTVDFDVAKDCLATYFGALKNTVIMLENLPDADRTEIAALREEKARVRHELNTLSPDDEILISRARFIYPRLVRTLKDDYLVPQKEVEEARAC